MKNIVKHSLAILCMAQLLSMHIIAGMQNSIDIFNGTTKPVYIALVKTQNYQGDKKIYIEPNTNKATVRTFAQPNGTLKSLSPGYFLEIDNFTNPPTSMAVTKYNRSLWASYSASNLLTALQNGVIGSGVYAFRVGREKHVVLGHPNLRSDEKYKKIDFQTNNTAVVKAADMLEAASVSASESERTIAIKK